MPSQTYFDLLKNHPSYLAALLFLTLCRLTPIIALAPFFGQKLLPQPAKIGLGICLFFIFLPHMMIITQPTLQWNVEMIGYAFKEITVGFVLGFLITMPFNVAQMAGILIDNQRGSSSMMGSDPVMGNQVSTIGQLYNFIAIIIFFGLNGPLIFIDAILKSYNIIPPDQYLPIDFFTKSSTFFWTYMIGLMAKIFALSIQIAAPSVVAVLMADVFLGIVNRLAPQIQISFLGMGLKAYGSDIALWAAWLFIIEQIGIISINFIKDINDLLDRINI